MKNEELTKIQDIVKKELSVCTDFWLKNGFDRRNGGVFTCLDRQGRVYSTDKSVWMQGRCAWTFSRLCNTYGNRKEWLEFAESCLVFCRDCCKNKNAEGRMYFSVTADGKPLRQRRYLFSEAFYAMACAEYYAATGNEKWLAEARAYYKMIYDISAGVKPDPVELPPKTDESTRKFRALSPIMIYLNLSSIMLKCDMQYSDIYCKRAKEAAETILKYHFKPELKVTLENVGLCGEFHRDITDGRHINPGHSIECAWFLMDQAKLSGNDEMFENAVSMMNFAVEKGWDNEYGGLLYFSDALGNPCETCEHDMKLWWPHCELLIASMKAYLYTKENKYSELFGKCFEYANNFFYDTEYGEWYGYLRRDGKPTEPVSKGTLYKGPFHLPRMLMMIDTMIDEIIKQ